MTIKIPKSRDMNFTKNLVKNHKLVPHLEKYLSKEIRDFSFEYTPKVGDNAWHPSGDCTPKVSELYDKASGGHESGSIGGTLRKTFLVGHFWHALLQKAVVDCGLADENAIERVGRKVWEYEETGDPQRIEVDHIQETVSVKDDRTPKPYAWAKGAGDVAPCSIPDHGDFVIDFKTMSGFQYKSNGIPNWAADKYEAQINIYMDFFDLDRGIIVAIQKDSPHEMKEFLFDRNQRLVDAIYDKWKFVGECMDSGYDPVDEDDELFDLDGLFTGPVSN